MIKLLDRSSRVANLVFVLPFMPRSLAWLLSERDTPLPERHAATLGRMLLAGLRPSITNLLRATSSRVTCCYRRVACCALPTLDRRGC